MDPVGEWLTGAWRRSYIRRAKPGSKLGHKDTSVDVIYVQTPEAFVDIRRPASKPRGKGRSKEATLAFGGVTSTVDKNNGDKMVCWHSCIDIDWKDGDYGSQKSSNAWTAADAGMPLETEDIGIFKCIQTNAPQKWLETDLGATLEEEWVKVVGTGPFLTLRRNNDLLVVAANCFALASREAFAAGTIEKNNSWIIELSASDRDTEGTPLVLEGSPSDWKTPPGSLSSIRYNERAGWEVGGACFPCPQFKSYPNLLDSRGRPELYSPPGQKPILKALKAVLLSLISLLVLPIMFVLVLFSASVSDTFRKVFLSTPLQREAVHDEEQTERVWQTDSGRTYALAVEWQRREGFCSSTTQRCLLKSCNIYLENTGHRSLPIPAVMGGPDTPEGFQTKIQKLLEDSGQKDRALVRIHRDGNKGEDDYEAFLEVLRLSVHPSGKYRVATNYLRSAIFGCQNFLPSTVLLSFLGGHFSPVVSYWESPVSGAQSEPMCAVFDVNQEYGMCILPCRKLYEASSTFDIMTGRRRGLVVLELNVAKQ